MNQEYRHKKDLVVRQRITPTFTHSNIFDQDDPSRALKTRYNPTFVSTLFQPEQLPINDNAKQRPKTTSAVVHVSNISQSRKQAFLNPHYVCPSGKNSDVDQKLHVLAQISQNQTIKSARMRKLVQQLSNPIFGGTWIQNKYQILNKSPQKQLKIEQPQIQPQQKLILSPKQTNNQKKSLKESKKQLQVNRAKSEAKLTKKQQKKKPKMQNIKKHKSTAKLIIKK